MKDTQVNRRSFLVKAGVLGGAGTLASLGVVGSQMFAHAQEASGAGQPDANTHSIEGSWRVTVIPQGVSVPPPFQALHTFTGDRAVTTAEQRDQVPTKQATHVPPTLASPGHGVWTQLPSNDGTDDFAYNYQKLLVDTQGNLVGTLIIHIKIELIEGGQAFKGSGSVVIQDAAGKDAAPDYTIMTHGTRI